MHAVACSHLAGFNSAILVVILICVHVIFLIFICILITFLDVLLQLD